MTSNDVTQQFSPLQPEISQPISRVSATLNNAFDDETEIEDSAFLPPSAYGFSELADELDEDEGGPMQMSCGCGCYGGAECQMQMYFAHIRRGNTNVASHCGPGSQPSGEMPIAYFLQDSSGQVVVGASMSYAAGLGRIEIDFCDNDEGEESPDPLYDIDDYWTPDSYSSNKMFDTIDTTFTWQQPAGTSASDPNIVRDFVFTFYVENGVEETISASFLVHILYATNGLAVEWHEANTNQAMALSGDPKGPGFRCFPEYVVPPKATAGTTAYDNSANYKKDVTLIFVAEEAVDYSRPIYYNFGDPDNRIGDVGSNPQTWTGNDNQSVLPLVNSTELPAGQTVLILTKTITITQGFAGDNFIAVASFNAADVDDPQFGTTEATRYIVQEPNGANASTPAQTQLLTVWRTLWMELDQMAMPQQSADDGFPIFGQGYLQGAWNTTVPPSEPSDFDLFFQPPKPETSLLVSTMKDACVEVNDVPQGADGGANSTWIVNEPTNADNAKNKWDTTTPFVHNLSDLNSSTATTIGNKSRDVNRNEPAFWCIQGVGAYEADTPNDWDGSNEGWALACAVTNDTGVFLIFSETIRDFAASGKSQGVTGIPDNTACKRTKEEINDIATFHEVLHLFGFADDPADGEIMTVKWLFTDTTTNIESLQPFQIAKIQLNDNPK